MTVGPLRFAAAKPAFFVGLLDFILAREPTAEDFACRFHFDPATVQAARDKLAPAEREADFD